MNTMATYNIKGGVGKKGKAIGHPFGTAMGHSADANTTLLSILWSYGGSYVGNA